MPTAQEGWVNGVLARDPFLSRISAGLCLLSDNTKWRQKYSSDKMFIKGQYADSNSRHDGPNTIVVVLTTWLTRIVKAYYAKT